MPRTTKPKPKSEPTSLTPPVPAVNGPAGEVLTLAEAAAYLRLPETDMVRLVTVEGLPGRLVGTEWRFFKPALQQWLGVSRPTAEMRKAAILAAAGAFKDDPDLEDMVEEIYRQRGRPITEDGSYRLFHGLKPEDFENMMLLDTDTLTLHQAGHIKVTERIANASEVPRITLVTQIEALRGRYDAVLKAAAASGSARRLEASLAYR